MLNIYQCANPCLQVCRSRRILISICFDLLLLSPISKVQRPSTEDYQINQSRHTSSLTFDNSDGLADSRDYYVQTQTRRGDAEWLWGSAQQFFILGVQVFPRSHQLGSWGFKSLLAVISWDLGGSSPSAVITWEYFNATRDPCPQQHAKHNMTPAMRSTCMCCRQRTC